MDLGMADPGTVEQVLDRMPSPETVGVVEPFRRMELEDERQILDELAGRALDVMLYSFKSDGRDQIGFSWRGVRETVRTMNARGWTRIKADPEVRPIVERCDTADGPGVR